MPTDNQVQPAVASTVPRKKRRWGRFIVVSLLINAGIAFYFFKVDTYHYVEVQPGVLYRDGNQGLRRFSTAIKRADVKTIIPLIDGKELIDSEKPQFQHEVEYAKEHGLKLAPVPVKLGGWPTTDDVRTFLDTATDPSNQPVLVHCAQGVRRTGMMVAAYQMTVLGYDKARAGAEIETFGHSERSIGDVRKFIDAYDSATRTVTKEFAISKE